MVGTANTAGAVRLLVVAFRHVTDGRGIRTNPIAGLIQRRAGVGRYRTGSVVGTVGEEADIVHNDVRICREAINCRYELERGAAEAEAKVPEPQLRPGGQIVHDLKHGSPLSPRSE